MIQLDDLREMFDGIAAGPRWDMSGPMRWGYFFTDESEENLQLAAQRLADAGYRVVSIYEAEVEASEPAYHWLHVERDEIHSPETLHERNQLLDRLADELGLRSYDGMDVGPPLA